jgi:hypothetical protein
VATKVEAEGTEPEAPELQAGDQPAPDPSDSEAVATVSDQAESSGAEPAPESSEPVAEAAAVSAGEG